jgi:histidinol-phosphate aminotransferase
MQSSSYPPNPRSADAVTGPPNEAGRESSRPVHGAIQPAELRRLGLRPEDVLDFSASISPLGPPDGVWEAMRRVDPAAYPDPQCLELREELSRHLGLGIDQILVGNGSTEIIHLLPLAFMQPPSPGLTNRAFLLTPTYSEYAAACRLARAGISTLDAHYSGGFCWDFGAARERIVAERPALVFVCNPNNPTGVYMSQSEVADLLDAVARVGGLLVLDEAYLAFVAEPWDALPLLSGGNLVLLRSMTKDFALTGLRLGYSLASSGVTERLASFQPDWSVNALAQAAGVAALTDADYLPRARQAVEQARQFLEQELTALGYTVLPSSANFLLVRVGNAAALRERLLRHGQVVRDCSSFGLPDCIRIGIRALTDCQRLVAAMGYTL